MGLGALRKARPIIPPERRQDGPQVRVPASPRMQQALAGLLELPRSEAVRQVKEARRDEWRHLGRVYLERINELTGSDIAMSLTAAVDTTILTLVERAMRSVQAPEHWMQEVGVFALGGYGRGEFNPYSDLDLMLIHQGSGSPAEWIRGANAELQTLLWDCGFQVGASMRGFAELERIIAHDFVTATALLEHRPLCASTGLAEAVRDLLLGFRQQQLRPFLRYKVEEVAARREQTGRALFVMEPNLKTSPGGLRDIQFLRNLSFMLFGSRTLHELRELETIEKSDVSNLLAANDHILGLRSLLHFHHEHRHDQFLLADQIRCASQLGYDAPHHFRAVELLLRDHYHKVSLVDQAVSLSIDRIHSLGHLGQRKPLIATRRLLTKGFAVVDKRVYLAERDYLRHPDYVERVLRMAHCAQQQNVSLSISLQRSIRAEIDAHILDMTRRLAPHADIFRAILKTAGRVAPILRDLHGSGFLGVYMPEFGRITCHMQFDAYHHYTVDEHTLLALEYLDRIARCHSSIPRVLQQVYTGVHRHDLLALGLLLHDVGKCMGKGHVARGALMVGPACRRLGLNEEETDLVSFLVREHVLLSDASRSRDFTDSKFLDQLAQRIGSIERLDILYCLTWPDAKAVGPKVLSGWQESLLEECFLTLRGHMEGRSRAHAGRRQAILTALSKEGIEEAQVQRWLSLMPDDYVYQIQAEKDAPIHLHIVQTALDSTDHAACAHGPHPSQQYCWWMALVLPDRMNLLADVAVVCAGHGLDIQGCRVWRVGRHLSLLSLRVSSQASSRWADERAWQRLEKCLKELSQQAADHQHWMQRSSQIIKPETVADSGYDDVEVRIDQQTTDSTVLDVRAKDRPGLLAALCQAVAESGCRIDFAQVSTMGDVAVDVFYLTHQGERLDHSTSQALCQRIEAVAQMEPQV